MSVISYQVSLMCAVSLAQLLALPAFAAQDVRVAAVYFPPYVTKTEQNPSGGLLADLLEALNQTQDDFHFVAVPTSVKRRFRDFEQQRIDLAIFENPEWDWKNMPHQTVDMGLEDSEVFVARAESGRDQHYFDELQGKRLALYYGYHYAFAHFNADPDYLTKTFSAFLTHSHDSNLLMVLYQRAEIALVTRSYIGGFLEHNPQYAGQLLISERADQYYHHHVVIRPSAPITAEQFEAIYEPLRDNGQLQRIFSRYQVAVMPRVTGSSVEARAVD